jgi:hypothetical protein
MLYTSIFYTLTQDVQKRKVWREPGSGALSRKARWTQGLMMAGEHQGPISAEGEAGTISNGSAGNCVASAAATASSTCSGVTPLETR